LFHIGHGDVAATGQIQLQVTVLPHGH
jgi:hypothetical protein